MKFCDRSNAYFASTRRGTRRDWKGLKLRAEIELKRVRHPVRWAFHQRLNEDGSLTPRTTRPGRNEPHFTAIYSFSD